jgi:hypothetical protein
LENRIKALDFRLPLLFLEKLKKTIKFQQKTVKLFLKNPLKISKIASKL